MNAVKIRNLLKIFPASKSWLKKKKKKRRSEINEFT